MVLQLLHRGAPLSRYLSNAHHVHGMCGCCALTQLRSPRRWSRRAKTHGLLVRRHGIFNRLRCAPDQRPTRERAANHGSGLRECRRPLPPACTCSPLTAVLRSTRLCRALPARPPPPPPSAARSPPLSSPPPAFFRRIRALLDAAAAAAGRCEAAWRFKAATQAAVAAPLLGGYHRAARAGHPRCSGGSGDASRLIDASLPPLMALQKSRQASAHFFLDCASACGVRVCSWKELTSGFPTV